MLWWEQLQARDWQVVAGSDEVHCVRTPVTEVRVINIFLVHTICTIAWEGWIALSSCISYRSIDRVHRGGPKLKIKINACEAIFLQYFSMPNFGSRATRFISGAMPSPFGSIPAI